MICILFSCASHAMTNDDLESGTDIQPHTKYVRRTVIQYCSHPRSPKYGAKIEADGLSSYVVTYAPQPEADGLISLLFGSDNNTVARTVTSVIPGRNITLWQNDDTSYDVIYRREDGVIVAEDLETGEAFYQIKLERAQGPFPEELLQSEQGVLQVTDKNGKMTTLSHRAYKRSALPSADEDQVGFSGHAPDHTDVLDDNE